MKVFTNHHRDINIFKAPKQILDLIYKYPDRFHQKCFLDSTLQILNKDME